MLEDEQETSSGLTEKKIANQPVTVSLVWNKNRQTFYQQNCFMIDNHDSDSEHIK